MNKETISSENSYDLDGVLEYREGTYSTLTFKRHFKADKERLWWAVSDCQGALLWLNPVDKLELTVGGAFSIRTYDENNPSAWTSGIVTEVEPPNVLEYTWNQGPYGGGPAMQSKVRYKLEPKFDGTTLTITHVLYDTAGDKYAVTFLANWHMHLDALTQVLSGKYQNFAEYIERRAEESGLSPREFLMNLVIGLYGAYAKKVGRSRS
ncbi:hypothetical protein OXPF_37040 [Oxobacter pfennigii]|uniref:Activator of Hsp90 ATPase homologue 1/2-like C-terminal domain-containing protein n=1 Tax=Oxobacter pfennigii TaxID=36849 RepID=A0A0P8YTB5_9CLOT|nr:SRPBCC domain-containing protein [Oxobacter pfennigii]KPU42935.1 hypothetical protein OXPF_37040 [Oxobacter pfennigii]